MSNAESALRETIENMLYTYDLMKDKKQFIDILMDSKEMKDYLATK